MATLKTPPIYRPMDPNYVKDFFANTKVNKKLVNGFISAISKYNEECTKAAHKLLEKLEELKKGME